MSYQNVGTPRFYINVIEWANSLGSAFGSGYHTLPVSPFGEWSSGGDYSTIESLFSAKNYVAALGHNMATEGSDLYIKDAAGGYIDLSEVVNLYPHKNDGHDGFTLATMTVAPKSIALGVYVDDGTFVDETTYIGSLLLGTYYTMPHAPDLNLTLTREYSGIKTLETKGGSSLSNDFGSSPPKWGDRSAWQLGDVDFSVGGRRIWDLSFSFLSDSSIFPETPTETSSPVGWQDTTTTPDFMSEVLRKCNGGQLPFIFQPDSGNSDPFSGFAICKFDQSSFQFKQVANSVYDVSLKIREVW